MRDVYRLYVYQRTRRKEWPFPGSPGWVARKDVRQEVILKR